MARLSFPNRYTHQVFYQRYRILSNPNHPVSKTLPLTLSPSLTPSEAQAQCDLLIQTLNKTSGELSASPSSSLAVDPHLQEEQQVTGALAVVATLQSNLLELGSRYVSIAKILSKIGLHLLAISYHRHHLVHIMFHMLTYIILIVTSSSSSSLSGGVTRKNTVVSGLSKVFLDKNAHCLLEAYRFHLLSLCTNKIGGLIMRKVILKKRSAGRQVAAVMTQRLVRGFIARRRYRKV